MKAVATCPRCASKLAEAAPTPVFESSPPSPELSVEDREFISEALRAMVEGPFIDDDEFATVIGATRKEVASVARVWPDVELGDPLVFMIVNNVLLNLAAFPHPVDEEAWPSYMRYPRRSIPPVLERWRVRRPGQTPGRRTGHFYWDHME